MSYEENTIKFNNLLAETSREEYYKALDANKALDIIYRIYNNAFYKAFPLKKITRNKSKDKKWITSALKTSIHHKDILFQKFLLSSTPESKLKYSMFRNKLTTLFERQRILST